MSADTYAAVEKALRDHITDEADGGMRMLTDWYCVTAAVTDEVNSTSYLHVSSDSSTHVLMGLARIGVRRLDGYYDLGQEGD